MEYRNASDVVKDDTHPMTEALIAVAIAGVVSDAQSQGQSLAEVTQLLLEDDQVLDQMTRQWLSEIVAEAWQEIESPAFLEAA